MHKNLFFDEKCIMMEIRTNGHTKEKKSVILMKMAENLFLVEL